MNLINFSGGENFDPYDDELVDALSEAIENYQGLFVCSSGNDGANLETTNIFPARLELDNVITVGASNALDQICSFSNYGADSVDLFAPGQAIYSTFSDDPCDENNCLKPDSHVSKGYHFLNGTSMAAPYVTGVAAMLWCIDGSLTRERVRSFIIDPDNTDYSTNFYNKCVTEGRLNAYKVVLAATTPCTHSNASYTYNANTHTLICPDCSYSLTEAHNDFSYTYNAYTHSLKCSDCPYITGNAVHTGSYVTYDANTHTYSCSVCSYSLSSAHELYVYSDNGEDGVTIKCNQCLYEKFCDIGVAEYGYGGETGHYVDCTCGCYSFFTAHTPQFITQTGSLYTHNVHCRDCNTVYPASHSWIPSGLGYECAMCAMTTLTIPDIMQIPSDDELLAASNDDLGAEDALLPAKEDDLVTE